MPDLSGYSLSDALLFSPRVYYRLFELHNLGVWPAQIAALAFGLVILLQLLRRKERRSGLVPVGLGALWLWVGVSYVWLRYATINWAAVYLVPLFVVEALLLVWIGLRKDHSVSPPPGSIVHMGIVCLAAFAILGYPLISIVMSRQWLSAEIFGIAPDPTAIATLAMLVPMRSRPAVLGMTIASLWCVISGLTLWTMESGDFFILPLCAIIAVCLAILSRRPRVPKL